ncbi:MAG: SAM-dependent methyltransferase [Geminicoccus sp.]|nr:SAM-dependent methyltransferase [Geminicoccus sp.]
MINETNVEAHYANNHLLSVIKSGLENAGLDQENLTAMDLSPVDEFHIGGTQATDFVIKALGISEQSKVIDIGCGIGGPARYVAEQVGCHVTGIDLTADYIAAGNTLCEWVGLGDRVHLEQASALELPYEAARFDAAYVMHVGMNIADKTTMMAEAFRVLRPGGCLVIYDVMTHTDDTVTYPMPWSDVPENSAIDSPTRYNAALTAAGFTIENTESYSDFAVAFFEGMMARMSDGPGPLGLHLLMGANTPEKIGNVYRQTKEGVVGPVLITCRKPG